MTEGPRVNFVMRILYQNCTVLATKYPFFIRPSSDGTYYGMVRQIKFRSRQFASIFVGVIPLLELINLEIHIFPHFSFTCFDILS